MCPGPYNFANCLHHVLQQGLAKGNSWTKCSINYRVIFKSEWVWKEFLKSVFGYHTNFQTHFLYNFATHLFARLMNQWGISKLLWKSGVKMAKGAQLDPGFTSSKNVEIGIILIIAIVWKKESNETKATHISIHDK